MYLFWGPHRGKVSFHSRVPTNYSLPTYMSDAVVKEMFNGWDLNKLKNEETLKGSDGIWPIDIFL